MEIGTHYLDTAMLSLTMNIQLTPPALILGANSRFSTWIKIIFVYQPLIVSKIKNSPPNKDESSWYHLSSDRVSLSLKRSCNVNRRLSYFFQEKSKIAGIIAKKERDCGASTISHSKKYFSLIVSCSQLFFHQLTRQLFHFLQNVAVA